MFVQTFCIEQAVHIFKVCLVVYFLIISGSCNLEAQGAPFGIQQSKDKALVSVNSSTFLFSCGSKKFLNLSVIHLESDFYKAINFLF